jgi:hypothetical protein
VDITAAALCFGDIVGGLQHLPGFPPKQTHCIRQVEHRVCQARMESRNRGAFLTGENKLSFIEATMI